MCFVCRSLQRMKSFGESPRFDRGRSVGGEGDDKTAIETAVMDTNRRDVPAEAVDAGAPRPMNPPAEAGGSVKKEVERIESRYVFIFVLSLFARMNTLCFSSGWIHRQIRANRDPNTKLPTRRSSRRRPGSCGRWPPRGPRCARAPPPPPPPSSP